MVGGPANRQGIAAQRPGLAPMQRCTERSIRGVAHSRRSCVPQTRWRQTSAFVRLMAAWSAARRAWPHRPCRGPAPWLPRRCRSRPCRPAMDDGAQEPLADRPRGRSWQGADGPPCVVSVREDAWPKLLGGVRRRLTAILVAGGAVSMAGERQLLRGGDSSGEAQRRCMGAPDVSCAKSKKRSKVHPAPVTNLHVQMAPAIAGQKESTWTHA